MSTELHYDRWARRSRNSWDNRYGEPMAQPQKQEMPEAVAIEQTASTSTEMQHDADRAFSIESVLGDPYATLQAQEKLLAAFTQSGVAFEAKNIPHKNQA